MASNDQLPFGGEGPQQPYFPPPPGQPYFPPPMQEQPPSQQPTPGPTRNHRRRNVILGIMGGLVVIIAIVAVAANGRGGTGNSPSTPAASSSSPSTETAQQQYISKLQSTTTSDGNTLYGDLQQAGDDPVTLANQICRAGSNQITIPGAWTAADQTAFVNAVTSTMCPGAVVSLPSPSPAAPQYTVSQQQAIDAAENYLSDGQGFSYAGLLQQLTSSYGNGFSQADATFALNHVQVDWDQQAAMSAKNYMSDGQGFSCSSLLQQLDSPYGGQFTQAQAEYGVQSVGLGTC